ncbi:choice-of-anchor Q domain-containing protein [Porifericola rhodea]|uniref:choice-of-anchor Q domain-containing protein n=1 Tax=Porifericola rhodea TaxID=930972 RepID=UPI002665ED17|nr:choice-of-anchor Q domain-containing protein [Porifericola rhodea]WKN30078.1 choice-of-anchor Q domain-containing protein [Porifericola rhodea]
MFRGGGLCIDSDGLVALNRVIVRHNVTGKGGGGGGGGIYNQGKLTINNSLIEANIGGNIGGGIGHHGEQLTINNSAIVNNEGYRSGLTLGGQAVLKNVTISGNHQSDDSFTATGGWGVTVFASVHMRNVTITDNGNTKVWMDLSNRGGGVLVTSQGRLTMQNSLVAENEVYDISGSITSNGFNLVGNAGQLNVLAASGDQLGSATRPINPRLDDLSYTGGFTPTHALLPGSPAIDGGSNLAPISDPTSCLSKDQRGVSRPQDGDGRLPNVCDIGAFELEP